MAKKITVKDMLGFELSLQEIAFTIEYCKDYAARRAAEAAGYPPDDGYRLLENPRIREAAALILENRREVMEIDAEWVLEEFVDNHYIARQQGKIAVSNAALVNIGKHSAVDAFAADKLINLNDQGTVDRLLRARKRTDTEEVSFL